MYCSKCGGSNNDDAAFCIQCGCKLSSGPNNEAGTAPENHFDFNQEFEFSWTKQFSYLTLKTVETKAVVKDLHLDLESRTYHLGFIKGKPRNVRIPLANIANIQTKTLINYFDIIFAAGFAIIGIFAWLFLLVAAIFLWTGLNTSIVVTNKSGEITKIPSDSKTDAQEFIKFVSEAACQK